MGVGGNQHAQAPPGYHTIHLARAESLNLKLGNHFQTEPCFPDPQLARGAAPPVLPGTPVPQSWGDIPETRATLWEPLKHCLGGENVSIGVMKRARDEGEIGVVSYFD